MSAQFGICVCVCVCVCVCEFGIAYLFLSLLLWDTACTVGARWFGV